MLLVKNRSISTTTTVQPIVPLSFVPSCCFLSCFPLINVAVVGPHADGGKPCLLQIPRQNTSPSFLFSQNGEIRSFSGFRKESQGILSRLFGGGFLLRRVWIRCCLVVAFVLELVWDCTKRMKVPHWKARWQLSYKLFASDAAMQSGWNLATQAVARYNRSSFVFRHSYEPLTSSIHAGLQSYPEYNVCEASSPGPCQWLRRSCQTDSSLFVYDCTTLP